MKHRSAPDQAGQANLEYALLIVLIAVIIIAVMVISGSVIANRLGDVANMLETPSSAVTSTPASATGLQVLADFQARILAYYNANGRWPRTWSPYNFTDLGLTPGDWSQPVDGLYFSPHGSEIGIANRAGDNLQVYVKDLNGNTLHLIDTWSIWCPVNSSTCYYHTVAPGNEVDISTIYVTGN